SDRPARCSAARSCSGQRASPASSASSTGASPSCSPASSPSPSRCPSSSRASPSPRSSRRSSALPSPSPPSSAASSAPPPPSPASRTRSAPSSPSSSSSPSPPPPRPSSARSGLHPAIGYQSGGAVDRTLGASAIRDRPLGHLRSPSSPSPLRSYPLPVPAVVLYFQAHQPRRMRRYSVFHDDPFYFDDTLNAEICRRVAQRCYVPVFGLLARLARRHEGAFRVSLGITGSLLDQLAEFAPAAMLALEDLASTGCCEPLAETDRHSLAFLYSPQEFRRQVDAHERRVVDLFGRPPRIFRHTECIYGNDLAVALCAMLGEDGRPRYDGALAEAVDHRLGYRSPHHVYRP